MTKLNYFPAGLFLLSVLIISGVYMLNPVDAHIPDADAYLRQGLLWLDTGVLSSHKMMPLYPLWTAISDLILGGPLLDILAAGANVVLVYCIATELISMPAARWASLIYLIHPFAIFYGYAGLTETIFVTTTLAGFYFMYRSRIVWASIFLVTGILIRPTLELLIPLLLVSFLFVQDNFDWKQIRSTLGTYALVYLLMMSPWWIHNYMKYGSFVRLNLGFGEMFYGGNSLENPAGRTIQHHDLFDEFIAIEDPVRKNDMMVEAGWNAIIKDPGLFLKKSIHRTFLFWNIVPNHEMYRRGWTIYILGAFELFLYIATVYYLFIAGRARNTLFIPVLLLFVYLTMVHAVTIGSIRYRFPLEAFLTICGGGALSHWAKCQGFKRLVTSR